MDNPFCIIPKMLASEINGSISWFYDAGFTWTLGDEMNGVKEDGQEDTYVGALQALGASAVRHYPESRFAKEWAA